METRCTVIGVAFALCVGFTAAAQEHEITVDEARAKVQEICPVTGNQLGADGDPLKARIGEQEIFLCCARCQSGKVQKEHWTKIHENFANAQKICLVMDNDLPEKPEWTIVEGRIFFVCCPPCIEKIRQDPDAYVKKLDAIYAKFARAD